MGTGVCKDDEVIRIADEIARGQGRPFAKRTKPAVLAEINRINSKVRGIIQYSQCCTWVNVAMKKHSRRLQLTAMRRLKQYKGKWILNQLLSAVAFRDVFDFLRDLVNLPLQSVPVWNRS